MAAHLELTLNRTCDVRIQFEGRYCTDLDLIGLPVLCSMRGGKERLRLGRVTFPAVARGSGGNWCWEVFGIGRWRGLAIFLSPEVRELYQPTGGDTDLWDLWEATENQATWAAWLCRRPAGQRPSRKRRRKMARRLRREMEKYVREVAA